MGVGSVNYSFTFAELESKVNGKYNRGELRLDAQGGLHRTNNHVWAQVFNNKTTTAQENLNVRTAVFDSISGHFSKSGGVSPYLKAAQEFLLGSENALKPLSRDEVRAIIAQLKSVADMEVIKASDALNLAEKSLSQASDKNEWLIKMSNEMDLDNEATQKDVDECEAACRRHEKALASLTGEYKKAYDEYAKLLGEVRERFANVAGAQSLLVDLGDSVESMLKNFEYWVSDCVQNSKYYDGELKLEDSKKLKLKNDVYLNSKTFNTCWKELREKVDEKGKELLGNFMARFNKLYDAVDGMCNKEIELKQAEEMHGFYAQKVSAKKQIDDLVETNKRLAANIAKNNGNVDEQRAQLKANEKEIARLRKKFDLDDLRAAGTLTQKDVDKVAGLQEKAAKDVEAAKKTVASAQAHLQDARSRDLSLDDFKLLLRTIRAVKEGANTVTRTEDGGFRLNGSYRAFDSRMVLWGLRSGNGREGILGQSTVNHGDAAVRARGANTPEAMNARATAQMRFDGVASSFGTTLSERLVDGFVGKKDQYLEQCEVTANLVRTMLDELDTSAVPGLRESLEPDIKALKKDYEEQLAKIKDGVLSSRTNDNDYRCFLELAFKRIDSFKGGDSFEVTEARNRLAKELHDLQIGKFIQSTAPERKPGTLNEHDLSILDTVGKAIAEKDIFKLDAAHWNTGISHVSAEAAKVLVDAFAVKSGIDVSSFAPGIVDRLRMGTCVFDDFVTEFSSGLKSANLYPAEGPEREKCEKFLDAMSCGAVMFESIIDRDARLERICSDAAEMFIDVFDGKKIANEGKLLEMIGTTAQRYGEVEFGMEDLSDFFIDSLEEVCNKMHDPELLPIADMKRDHQAFVDGKLSLKDFSSRIYTAVSSLPGGVSFDSMALKIMTAMPAEFWDPPEIPID